MSERPSTGSKAQEFFEGLWRTGDYWDLEGSPFERIKYRRQFEMIAGRRYARVLEIGCGNGCFTRLLAGVADRVVALDISPSAVEQARVITAGLPGIDFRVDNIMKYHVYGEGPWDLIVMSETVYYLGWLYSLADVGWLAGELFGATRDGGRFLMANTFGDEEEDGLPDHRLIRTYRDLFLNMGYRREAEEVFRPTGTAEVLVTLFTKAVRDSAHGRESATP